MRLSELLSALPSSLSPRRRSADGSADPVIRGIAYDSRSVTAGDLFFAIRGELSDGHDYAQQALDLGAAALIVETLPDLDLGGRPAVEVPDARRALAPISTRFFGEPSSEITLVGITGTNGKTSTTYLLESILLEAGRRPGLIGTVEVRFGDERRRSLNTTPESFDLQSALRSMLTRGADSVLMEVSSHGLSLGRVEGCRFDVAAFTNLSQDHLDFHSDMDAYRDAKAALFRHYLAPGGRAVLNLDDDAAEAMATAARENGATVMGVTADPARAGDADVALEKAEYRLDGTRARVRLPSGPCELSLPLLGEFNVENMLVACGVAVALDIDADAIARGVSSCPQVPGRVERVGADIPDAPTVLVDYAHTPDAVEKVARTLKPLTPGRLISVFGCGGDRDRKKRPLMAEGVARFSDRIIATSDNPRTEAPLDILADVEEGLRGRTRARPDALEDTEGGYSVLEDRRSAIELAIRIARKGDTVLIAGKGHEDYQIVGRERLPFSDCDEARRALENRSES